MQDEDEAELVKAAVGGDGAALNRLIELHYGCVYRYVQRVSGSQQATVQDLVQSTLLTVVRRIGSFEFRSSVRTWMLGIAANQVRAHWRRRSVRLRLARLLSPASAHGEDVAAIVDGDSVVKRVREAFGSLPIGQREALYLRDYLEYSYADIAEILGVSMAAVKNRLHLGRRRLAGILDGVQCTNGEAKRT